MAGESESDRFATLIRQHYQVAVPGGVPTDALRGRCRGPGAGSVRAGVSRASARSSSSSSRAAGCCGCCIDCSSIYDGATSGSTCGRSTTTRSLRAASRVPPKRRIARSYRWRIEDAWRHLSEEQRLLLALHDVEGYSLAEIHSLTGLKDGTIKSRLHRARVRLGRLLQRERQSRPLRTSEVLEMRCEDAIEPYALSARSRASDLRTAMDACGRLARTAMRRCARSMRCARCATSRRRSSTTAPIERAIDKALTRRRRTVTGAGSGAVSPVARRWPRPSRRSPSPFGCVPSATTRRLPCRRCGIALNQPQQRDRDARVGGAARGCRGARRASRCPRARRLRGST